MNRFRSAVLTLALGILLTGPVQADVLLMDSIDSAPAAESPRAGMTMAGVRAKYGNPAQEYPAVSTSGDPLQPPITRWDYDTYSVFFENDLVLHSVLHRAAAK